MTAQAEVADAEPSASTGCSAPPPPPPRKLGPRKPDRPGGRSRDEAPAGARASDEVQGATMPEGPPPARSPSTRPLGARMPARFDGRPSDDDPPAAPPPEVPPEAECPGPAERTVAPRPPRPPPPPPRSPNPGIGAARTPSPGGHVAPLLVTLNRTASGAPLPAVSINVKGDPVAFRCADDESEGITIFVEIDNSGYRFQVGRRGCPPLPPPMRLFFADDDRRPLPRVPRCTRRATPPSAGCTARSSAAASPRRSRRRALSAARARSPARQSRRIPLCSLETSTTTTRRTPPPTGRSRWSAPPRATSSIPPTRWVTRRESIGSGPRSVAVHVRVTSTRFSRRDVAALSPCFRSHRVRA